MEKQRRNTLDRFQRLGFGRKSSNNTPVSTSLEADKTNHIKNVKSSEKSEKLRELTELLRGNRSSTASPPVPPPRKPRTGNHSVTNSIDNSNAEVCLSLPTVIDFENSSSSFLSGYDHMDRSNKVCNTTETILKNKDSKSTETDTVDLGFISTNVAKAESRTVIGSYTQKGIPFRSASFSQIDFTSNNKNKPILSSLRDRLRREKAIDIESTKSNVKGNNSNLKSEPEAVCNSSLVTEIECTVRLANKENLLNDCSKTNTANTVAQGATNIQNVEKSINDPEEKLLVNEGKCKSLTEATFWINDYTLDEEHLPLTVDSGLPCTHVKDDSLELAFNDQNVDVINPNLVKLLEEEVRLESPPDNILQTATTCLIPVPVFECAAQEWRLENPPHEWVEVLPEEFGIIPESVNPTVLMEQCPIIKVDNNTDYKSDKLTDISCNSSFEDTEETQILRQKKCQDYRDGKKRYSYDDMEIDIEKRSSKDSYIARNNNDERNRIDKSRRRKGMYIENADWTNKELGLNIPVGQSSHGSELQPVNKLNLLNIKHSATDDNYIGESLCSLDLNTPESESNRAPTWIKLRSASPSYESTEEKDQFIVNENLKSLQDLAQAKREESSLHTESSDNEMDSPQILLGDLMSFNQLRNDDCKRYSKRPLRGPYGQMLEAEMKKQNKIHIEKSLEELRETDIDNLRRNRNGQEESGGRHLPKYSNSMRVRKENTSLPIPTHIRASSTPSNIEDMKKYKNQNTNELGMDENAEKKGCINSTRTIKRASSEAPISAVHSNHQSLNVEKAPYKRSFDKFFDGDMAKEIKPTPKLLAELLKGSSERVVTEQRQQMLSDTRTHVVQEILKNEQSYVESLQTVVSKYLKVLKTPEHAGMIDSRTVDEIFFMVPDILEIHEKFLLELKTRFENWSASQKVGDAFIETFSKLEVLEVYTSFVNNCNRAKNAIRTTKHQRPSFAKFLETTAREHKGKLSLDNLLIKPVQKFPNYEMLFQRLIKHTEHDHPDQKHLQEVLKLVHDILVHINCKEREILENGQREATLRELEGVIEGITDLITSDRQFLLFELVSMPSGQGARKERGFFLFNDLLVLTSIKKRSGTIRKPNSSTSLGNVASTLDTNKYKFLTKISLDCLEIVKHKDESVKRIMEEIENLAEDCTKLQKISDITSSLKYPHQYLEDVVRELQREVQRQLSERQTNDTQLNMLELTVNSSNGPQHLSIVFSKPEKRTAWEEAFNEAKQKLVATLERHPIPEFLTSIPIRKTRAGLQFTCASATLSEKRDVWVCNSDGYVGQVCIMSLHPEPNVTSCNGVCNARILCLASVPAYDGGTNSCKDDRQQDATRSHSYTQQLLEYRKSISPNCQSKTTIGNSRKHTQIGISAINANSSNTELNKMDTTSNKNEMQLDLNLSSSDEETDLIGSSVSDAGSIISSTEAVQSAGHSMPVISPPTKLSESVGTNNSRSNQDLSSEDVEGNQSTMWIGTEDGCIHIYNSTDNIRIKKNRIKIEHHSPVYSILYLDNRVFVALANGDICVYLRDGNAWNTNSSHCVSIGTVTSPVTKLLNVNGKLWCSIQGIIKVLDVETLLVTNQIQISSDSKPITNMTLSNNYVWISIQNSAHIKCFHSISYQLITEVNLAPAVNKMLSNCDEIIRQHKAACLRVTSLLSCKDLIWIGTSAGVLLTIPSHSYEKGTLNVVPTGVPHGHTGHVRFITFVETTNGSTTEFNTTENFVGESDNPHGLDKNKSSEKQNKTKCGQVAHNILIISGGDGYEDFRNSGANSLSEIAGREDSTNHLLIWQI